MAQSAGVDGDGIQLGGIEHLKSVIKGLSHKLALVSVPVPVPVLVPVAVPVPVLVFVDGMGTQMGGEA